MIAAAVRGVKAGVTDGMKSSGWRVPKQPGDELVGAQAQGLDLAVMVIGVVEGDAARVHEKCPVLGQWPALGIASQVQRDAAPAGVRRIDLNVPVRAVQRRDDAAPVGKRLAGRQVQLAALEQVLQTSQELAAEQPLQGLKGQQVGVAGGQPAAIGGQAASGDEGVDVGVAAQGTAPGVQRQQQPGQGAEVARIGEHLQQALAHAVEEQPGHGGAVERPQRQQLVRQREDAVEVRARQQPGKLRIDPGATRSVGAARAAAVAAGVELFDLEVAVRTTQRVAARARPIAVGDAPGRARLARVQAAQSRVARAVLTQDVAQGALHEGHHDKALEAAAYTDSAGCGGHVGAAGVSPA